MESLFEKFRAVTLDKYSKTRLEKLQALSDTLERRWVKNRLRDKIKSRAKILERERAAEFLSSYPVGRLGVFDGFIEDFRDNLFTWHAHSETRTWKCRFTPFRVALMNAGRNYTEPIKVLHRSDTGEYDIGVSVYSMRTPRLKANAWGDQQWTGLSMSHANRILDITGIDYDVLLDHYSMAQYINLHFSPPRFEQDLEMMNPPESFGWTGHS